MPRVELKTVFMAVVKGEGSAVGNGVEGVRNTLCERYLNGTHSRIRVTHLGAKPERKTEKRYRKKQT